MRSAKLKKMISPKKMNEADEYWMSNALVLAARGLGRVAPNPAVGCVIVRDGRLVARGWTQPEGRPHAETEALRRAGDQAKGADVYVTLEPCAHKGETGACTQALIKAEVARVICALQDPDPRVNGTGLQALRKAGVEVVEDVLADEAASLNAGYLLHRRAQRPLVTLKIAASLDGRIAAPNRHSRWITSQMARRYAHWLRATHDAILVGSRTARADNPELTCRLPGMAAHTPTRIVADSHLSIDLASKLVQSADEHGLWILCRDDTDSDRREALTSAGAKLFDTAINQASGLIDIKEALTSLAREGVTRLLVEGGSRIAASFLREGFVDRVAWFVAPMVIGGDGVAAVAGMGFDRLNDVPHFRPLLSQPLGRDMMMLFERVKESPNVHRDH